MRSIVGCKQLLLAASFLPAGDRLGFDDFPFLLVVLESPARHFRQQLFADDYRSEPVRVTVIRFDREFDPGGAEDALDGSLSIVGSRGNPGSAITNVSAPPARSK